MFRICPVITCKKRIYDPMSTGARKTDDEFDHTNREVNTNDPMLIQDEMSVASTPQTRTRTMMEMHIIGYHPQTAMEMGIGKAPELPRLAVVS